MSKEIGKEEGVPDSEERRRIMEQATRVLDSARLLMAQLDWAERHRRRAEFAKRLATAERATELRAAA